MVQYGLVQESLKPSDAAQVGVNYHTLSPIWFPRSFRFKGWESAGAHRTSKKRSETAPAARTVGAPIRPLADLERSGFLSSADWDHHPRNGKFDVQKPSLNNTMSYGILHVKDPKVKPLETTRVPPGAGDR